LSAGTIPGLSITIDPIPRPYRRAPKEQAITLAGFSTAPGPRHRRD